MKIITTLIIAAALMTGCTSEASTASYNLSKAADQFEVDRRVVFFNGITDTYLLTIEGRCSIEPDTLDGQLEVTCLVGEGEYKKHFLGLSDNVSYFIEQTDSNEVDPYRYRVMFRPTSVIPDVDFDAPGSS
jgi:hypothetical protein